MFHVFHGQFGDDGIVGENARHQSVSAQVRDDDDGGGVLCEAPHTHRTAQGSSRRDRPPRRTRQTQTQSRREGLNHTEKIFFFFSFCFFFPPFSHDAFLSALLL